MLGTVGECGHGIPRDIWRSCVAVEVLSGEMGLGSKGLQLPVTILFHSLDRCFWVFFFLLFYILKLNYKHRNT